MRKIRRLLVLTDDVIHVAVAIFLVIAAIYFLYEGFIKLLNPNTKSVVEMVGDLLFVLLIMEFLWTIIRYLKRLPFSLCPLIYVGIISSIRGMVLMESKMRFEEPTGIIFYQQLAEVFVFSLIVFILILCLFLLSKIPQQDPED